MRNGVSIREQKNTLMVAQMSSLKSGKLRHRVGVKVSVKLSPGSIAPSI